MWGRRYICMCLVEHEMTEVKEKAGSIWDWIAME